MLKDAPDPFESYLFMRLEQPMHPFICCLFGAPNSSRGDVLVQGKPYSIGLSRFFTSRVWANLVSLSAFALTLFKILIPSHSFDNCAAENYFLNEHGIGIPSFWFIRFNASGIPQWSRVHVVSHERDWSTPITSSFTLYRCKCPDQLGLYYASLFTQCLTFYFWRM